MPRVRARQRAPCPPAARRGELAHFHALHPLEYPLEHLGGHPDCATTERHWGMTSSWAGHYKAPATARSVTGAFAGRYGLGAECPIAFPRVGRASAPCARVDWGSPLHDVPARHCAGMPVSRHWLSVTVRDEDAPEVGTAPRRPVVARLHRIALQVTLVVPAHGVELHPAAWVAAGARAGAVRRDPRRGVTRRIRDHPGGAPVRPEVPPRRLGPGLSTQTPESTPSSPLRMRTSASSRRQTTRR